MKHISIVLMVISSLLLLGNKLSAQTATLQGRITAQKNPVPYANISIGEINRSVMADSLGYYQIKELPLGLYRLSVSAVNHEKIVSTVQLSVVGTKELNIELLAGTSTLHEVVVSGTLKEVSRLDSPVPVEVYTAKFFKRNPTPTVFEALQNINGVRPQLNCNVCNTGDIHINGLEGPYTMVLIDGMPIVSGLSTVYGLSGIPQSLIDRVEIVKGPASTLYGSEAVGGLINVVTKKPESSPSFGADVFGTTWGELNADLASRFKLGQHANALLGLNYFNYQQRMDNNADNFTDMTLQNRIALFNKWNFNRKDNRLFSLAARYVYEDRWGGDVRWNKTFRGGDSLYAESIYTSRWETFGTYQLPLKEQVFFRLSANGHHQNSVYGTMPYLAKQYIAFGQLNWNKQLGKNDLMFGTSLRYTYFDDNTPATSGYNLVRGVYNQASHTYLPGLFVQDELRFNTQNSLLMGLRYDYNSIHGNIFSPRVNYKWSSKDQNSIVRLSIGNGYRVANVFTEDHAALTGARELEFVKALQPETSWNGSVNFVKNSYLKDGTAIGIDATAFYTYFTNKIIADYDSNPNKIIYDNLSGYAISKGLSLNIDLAFYQGLRMMVGATLMNVYHVEQQQKTRQLFTERFMGVWSLGYTIKNLGITVDYTGNLYSPMRLPLLSNLDPRRAYSPWWSIQNIQLTKQFKKGFELYGGVKNLLNWTPNKSNPFIIARTNDPFDKHVQFDGNGQVLATPDNPYALTFDPTYVYGPNQGIRVFLGLRYVLQ